MNHIKRVFTSLFLATVFLTSVIVVNAADVFYIIDGYKIYENDENGFTIDDFTDESVHEISIPSEFLNKPVTRIGMYAFMDKRYLTSASFDEAVNLNMISQNAFNNCTGLTEIYLPSQITTIAKSAFQNCSGLQTAVIDSSITELTAQTFYQCTSLSSVTLPDSLQTISNFAFGACTSLEEIFLSNNITSIGDRAFYNSPNVDIVCYSDSYAARYALDKGITYSYIGDPDRNDEVNINDVTSIQKNIAKLIDFDDKQFMLGDFNRDGVINIIDATAVQRFIARLS